MFVLNFSTLWSLSFFFFTTYVILFFSFLFYLLPIVLASSNLKNTFRVHTTFYIVGTLEASFFILVPLLVIAATNLLWSSTELSLWFGHLVFASYQSKVIYFIFFIFYLVSYVIASTTYLSSNEFYDVLITKFNFLYWVILLFMTNSTFTLMFIIEVISTLIFLLLTTSVFSTSFFYKNINFDSTNFFAHTGPFTFLQSILYFFWISLISSLNLFVFLIYFFQKVVTFEWFVLEHIFFYLTNITTTKDLFTIGLSWFFIIFAIFLKCGISPLFLWKPVFFKGLTLLTLVFYIAFFYFNLFLFLLLFLTTYMHSIFYYYFVLNLFIVSLGLISLFFILCEAFYLKTFFAVSSILNSLFVFLSISSTHTLDFFFLI